MTDPTPRDRALAGEVVKLSDQRLAEMQHIATSDTVQHPNSTRWHWLAVFNELIAARKEIERLKAERASAVGFTDLPPRPQRPTRILDVSHATSEEARAHYMMMADYWIAEAHWQEKRADQLNAELTALMKDHVPRSRYDACNADWLAAQNECTRIAARAKEEIESLTARVAELEKERDANADDASALRLQASHALEEAQRFRFGLKKLLHATTHLGSVCGLDNSTALAWMEVWGATEIAKGLLCSDPSSSGATP